MQQPQPETVTLDNIVITEALSQRLPRPANWLSENQAVRSLARQMVNAPEIMLQSVVEMAVELCQAGTADGHIVQWFGAATDIKSETCHQTKYITW